MYSINLVEKLQKDFKKNSRQSIMDFIKYHRKTILEINKVEIFQLYPYLFDIYVSFHYEYSNLFLSMEKLGDIDWNLFKNDIDGIIRLQRNQEFVDAFYEYEKIKEGGEGNAIRIARAYASSLELIWKQLKLMVIMAGLNPKGRYLSIPQLKIKVEKLEKKYKISLLNFKEVLNSKLRNSIDHEDVYFEPPNIIVFLDSKSGATQEIDRMTIDQTIHAMMTNSVIDMVFAHVLNSSIMGQIEPFLNLTDEELKEFFQTEVLTPDMKLKMYET